MHNGLDHELEILLLETIHSANSKAKKAQSISKSKYAIPILRALRNVDDEVYKKAKDSGDVFQSLQRLAHSQFEWQEPIDAHFIFQYYHIYNHELMADIVKESTGLTVLEIFANGIFFGSRFQEFFVLPRKSKSDMQTLSTESMNTFIELFCIELPKLRQEVRQILGIDDKILYVFNPMRYYPIISINDKIFCPIPRLLFWQVTNGLYYRLKKNGQFGNRFGKAFEDFILSLISRIEKKEIIRVIPEFEYFIGNKRKDSIDYIIEDSKENLFIECKTKRLTQASKFSFSFEEIENDFNKMVNFLEQAYESFNDYVNGHYDKYPYNNKLKSRILILTLENWYLQLNITIMEMLSKELENRLSKKNNFNIKIEDVPFYIHSSLEFQTNIQIINSIGLEEYFEMYENNTLPDFKKDFDVVNLFKDDFDNEILSKLKG